MADPPDQRSERPSYDWDALFIKWLHFDGNLDDFRKEIDISRSYFYERAKQFGWIGAKEQVRDRARIRAVTAAEKSIAKGYKSYLDLNKAARAHSQKILMQGVVDGELKTPLDPRDLRAVIGGLKDSLGMDCLINGDPTERTALQVEKSDKAEFVEMVAKVIAEEIPECCAHCKTNLGLGPKIAARLLEESKKLEAPGVPGA